MRLTALFSLMVTVSLAVSTATLANPWADQVVSYLAGSNADAGYDDPAAALGQPTRRTAGWPSGDTDVTMFNSAWRTSEVVSIGAGGHLVVKFDQPVTDDPLNPYGIDLLIFGNATFSDAAWPDGVAGGTWAEPGRIAVSQDGAAWYDIATVLADDLFPTQAYTDTSGPYAADGKTPTDFTRPVDPAIDWQGKTYGEILALYDGSGGGAGVDIGPTGLGWVQYVKIWQPATDEWSTDIDALADVAAIPEPASVALLILGLAGWAIRRDK